MYDSITNLDTLLGATECCIANPDLSRHLDIKLMSLLSVSFIIMVINKFRGEY